MYLNASRSSWEGSGPGTIRSVGGTRVPSGRREEAEFWWQPCAFHLVSEFTYRMYVVPDQSSAAAAGMRYILVGAWYVRTCCANV